MLRFTNEKTISAIKRQVYVGNLSSSTTVGSGTGYLRPLSQIASSNNGYQFGQAFDLILEIGVDVQNNDVVVIDGVEYTVNGIAIHDRGFNTQYQKALISKTQV